MSDREPTPDCDCGKGFEVLPPEHDRTCPVYSWGQRILAQDAENMSAAELEEVRAMWHETLDALSHVMKEHGDKMLAPKDMVPARLVTAMLRRRDKKHGRKDNKKELVREALKKRGISLDRVRSEKMKVSTELWENRGKLKLGFGERTFRDYLTEILADEDKKKGP